MPKFFKQKGSVYLIIALVSLGIGVAATFIKSTPVQAPSSIGESTEIVASSSEDDTPPTLDLSKLLEAAQAEQDSKQNFLGGDITHPGVEGAYFGKERGANTPPTGTGDSIPLQSKFTIIHLDAPIQPESLLSNIEGKNITVNGKSVPNHVFLVYYNPNYSNNAQGTKQEGDWVVYPDLQPTTTNPLEKAFPNVHDSTQNLPKNTGIYIFSYVPTKIYTDPAVKADSDQGTTKSDLIKDDTEGWVLMPKYSEIANDLGSRTDLVFQQKEIGSTDFEEINGFNSSPPLMAWLKLKPKETQEIGSESGGTSVSGGVVSNLKDLLDNNTVNPPKSTDIIKNPSTSINKPDDLINNIKNSEKVKITPLPSAVIKPVNTNIKQLYRLYKIENKSEGDTILTITPHQTNSQVPFSLLQLHSTFPKIWWSETPTNNQNKVLLTVTNTLTIGIGLTGASITNNKTNERIDIENDVFNDLTNPSKYIYVVNPKQQVCENLFSLQVKKTNNITLPYFHNNPEVYQLSTPIKDKELEKVVNFWKEGNEKLFNNLKKGSKTPYTVSTSNIIGLNTLLLNNYNLSWKSSTSIYTTNKDNQFRYFRPNIPLLYSLAGKEVYFGKANSNSNISFTLQNSLISPDSDNLIIEWPKQIEDINLDDCTYSFNL